MKRVTGIGYRVDDLLALVKVLSATPQGTPRGTRTAARFA
jgi:hypothetical protein